MAHTVRLWDRVVVGRHHRQLREFTRRTAFSCLEKLGAKKREEMGEADTDPMQRERMQALR